MTVSKLPDWYDSVPVGWHALLSALHFELTVLEPGYEVHQAKEKFGGLRVYISPHRGDLQELLFRYESASIHVCEICGHTGDCFAGPERGGRGWIHTFCAPCRAAWFTCTIDCTQDHMHRHLRKSVRPGAG